MRSELLALVLTAGGHILVKLLTAAPDQPAHVPPAASSWYNVAAILGWSTYLLGRAARTPNLLREWGFRSDNFRDAWARCLLVLALGIPSLLAWGWLAGTARNSPYLWLILPLYPIYGVLQQSALQIVIARNLPDVIRSPQLRSVIAAALFSAAHAPDVPLMLLTFPAGFLLSRIYQRWPNLWAIGIAHGLLGAVAYDAVLGIDSGGAIIAALRRLA